MNYDPHVLHHILVKIQDQMRCPQCSSTVSVGFPSVKLAGDDFILLQLKCGHCQAFIVLHVTLSGKTQGNAKEAMANASSRLQVSENELETLQSALEQSGGSFESLFKKDAENVPRADKPDMPGRFV